MPIEFGPYCQYCVDETGKLQDFERRFEGMVAFTMGQEPTLSREEAEAKTRAYMSNMPAWRGHPGLR